MGSRQTSVIATALERVANECLLAKPRETQAASESVSRAGEPQAPAPGRGSAGS